jgi:thiamine-phosphate pyrophosphorylase
LNPDVFRILDANINRAREAVRVMEDYARFVLDDAAGSSLLKGFRHDFATAVRMLSADGLLAARDTPNDVGTAITTPAEGQRGDARDVFTAAAKRLPEALRTIEEYGKIVSPDFAARIEALRYRAYELEARIASRGERVARLAKCRLYVIVTASLCRGDWLEVTRQAIDGGAGCIQLREKGLEDGDLLRRARQLVAVCRERGVLCIINDRPDIARLADADGVHLGQTDMSVGDARRIVGADRLIGLSTHNPDQLREAIAIAPDYIAVGPMFPSTTKPQDHVPGVALLAEAVASTHIPIVPIGGIIPANLPTLRSAGASRVCVCSAVIAAEDVAAAARAFGV